MVLSHIQIILSRHFLHFAYRIILYPNISLIAFSILKVFCIKSQAPELKACDLFLFYVSTVTVKYFLTIVPLLSFTFAQMLYTPLFVNLTDTAEFEVKSCF